MRPTIPVTMLIFCTANFSYAQSKPPVPPADYGQWEALQTFRDYGGLSPDGKWLAYGINRSNRNNELRVTNIADGTTKTVAFGTQPAFTSDSRWVAYSIGISESQEEKLKKDKKPVPKKIGLLNLISGELSTVDGIDSFAFSPDGAWLAMRRTPPEKKDSEKKGSADTSGEDETPGATLLLRQLSAGRDTSFGNVSEYAWQNLPKTGTLLAMTINAEDKTGNGVQIFDVHTASVRVLDTSASIYSGLSWRKKSSDLAVLRSKSDDHRDGSTQVALAWTNLGQSSESAHLYDPTADSKLPTATRTVSFHRPEWALDGGIVFLGLAKWEDKIAEPAKPATPDADGVKSGEGSKAADGTAKDADTAKNKEKDDDDPPTVDVWNWHDSEVMPRQKFNAKNDRQKNMLAAWRIEKNSLVPLGKDLDERVTPLEHQPLAVSADWSAYAMERSIGRPAADISLVDISTGARTKIQDRLNDDHYLEESPGGHYLLYFHDDNYWTVNTASRAVVNITKGVQTVFVDRESDETIKQKPAFGVAGWTKDDDAVMLYDKFDLWQVAPDGSKAVRITDGAAEQVRHRYEKLN